MPTRLHQATPLIALYAALLFASAFGDPRPHLVPLTRAATIAHADPCTPASAALSGDTVTEPAGSDEPVAASAAEPPVMDGVARRKLRKLKGSGHGGGGHGVHYDGHYGGYYHPYYYHHYYYEPCYFYHGGNDGGDGGDGGGP